jgi:type I restriction enzyme M protein
MFDDKSIDVSKEVSLVWSIANSLRGAYTSDKYKDVIIPMVIIRRFECALAEKKDAVVAKYKANPNLPAAILCQVSGYPFYNSSDYTLAKLLNDPDNIASNFQTYIEGFSANVQTILNNLDFTKQIEKMDKNNRLYSVVKKFSKIDFNPQSVDGMKMGYIFEDIIRRFSENAEAGDHYTPREVIRLLVNILLAEGCDDLLTEEGKVATVLDAACGSGGMLSTTFDFLRRKNPQIDVRLFGQEIIDNSYAICLADMMIKGQDTKNIMGGEKVANTLMIDCFPDQKMRLVIMNPPFGQAWGGKDAPDGQEKSVRDEFIKGGRFEHGLPGTGDGQLLFMQHAINKMDDRLGRAAIISNGSPLFAGGTTSGESQIRRWMLEEDLVEAIIALPSQLFYNTDIGIYAFILSKNKRPDRRGKVQLINAVDMWKPLRKSLGKKRREIDKDSMLKIVKIYADFKEGKFCKIFPNEEFLYKEYAVYQPLQRRAVLNDKSIEKLRVSAYFTSNSNLFNESDFTELAEINPRSAADEKRYKKYIAGQKFVADVLAILETNKSDQVYMDYSEFEKHLKSLLSIVDGYSDSRLNSIAMTLSEMDKSAVVQKDRKGKIIIDPTTKDSEIIKLNKNAEKYFEEEVYPHVPDAIWFYEFNESKKESATNRKKKGAEFPFTRFFYEYKAPEKADDLLEQFMELEKSLTAKIAELK